VRCRSPQPSATISLAAVATCVRQPLSEILQSAAAGRWRRARGASYLLFYASPCLKLKLALVVLNVLRALPQSAAIRSHQPGRCGYLRTPAAVRNPAVGSSRPVEACARSVISPLLRVALPQTKARPGRPQRAPCAAAVRSHPQPSAWPLWLPAYASRCQKSCSRQQPAGGGVRVLVVSALACCPAPRCSGALS
jgi:hypothetical protein